MNILIFQHASSEPPGTLTDWIKSRRYRSTVHYWYMNPRAPDIEGFDWLIVLGGAMNVDEEKEHPWLKEEKLFIKDWVSRKMPYLGLCLGGQLLAQALGGKITKTPQREIGFQEVSKTGKSHPALRSWPDTSRVYQFHEDTFSIPPGCENLLSSPACPNQAFARDARTLGLQFHPESTREWILANAPSIKPRGSEPYVQDAAATAAEVSSSLSPMTQNFFRLLDDFVAGMK
jgi:GMP synthase-like glutamine amidotransferase